MAPDPERIREILAANTASALPATQYGPVLRAVRGEAGLTLDEAAKKLTELDAPITASSLLKYEKATLIKTIPVTILRAALELLPEQTRKSWEAIGRGEDAAESREAPSRARLRVGWSNHPDRAFLRCLPKIRLGDDAPMDQEAIEFVGPYKVDEHLKRLDEGEFDLAILSNWRINEGLRVSRVEQITPPELPLFRVRNNQLAIAGSLIGRDAQPIQPFAAFYFEACRLARDPEHQDWQQADWIAFGLTRTLAQITTDAETGGLNLQLVDGKWVAAFTALVEISEGWLRGQRKLPGGIDETQVAVITQLKKALEAIRADSRGEPQNGGIIATSEQAYDRVRKSAAQSAKQVFFTGNLATRMIVESEHAVPVLLNNAALEAIASGGPWRGGYSSERLYDLFFPPYHVVVSTRLSKRQRSEVERLRQRWNYLVPRLTPGSAHLRDASNTIDSVLRETEMWEEGHELFARMMGQQCFEFRYWEAPAGW